MPVLQAGSTCFGPPPASCLILDTLCGRSVTPLFLTYLLRHELYDISKLNKLFLPEPP